MPSSGITRRIDELGRLVIPKEMRYNLGIRDGEPLEIFINDGSIIIKKFSQVENIKNVSESICEIISDVCNVEVLITDREKIIAASKELKNLINTPLGDIHKKLVDNRETYISKNTETMFDVNKFFTILPIITSIDCSGLIFIISNNTNNENIKYAKIIQKLLVQKLDIV